MKLLFLPILCSLAQANIFDSLQGYWDPIGPDVVEEEIKGAGGMIWSVPLTVT